MAMARSPCCSFASTIVLIRSNRNLTHFSLINNNNNNDNSRSKRRRNCNATFLLHPTAIQPFTCFRCSVPSSVGPPPPQAHLNQLNRTDMKPVGGEHYDDIRFLFQILPPDLRNTLLHDSKQSQLLEVVLDLGKLPQARYIGHSGRQFLRSTEVTLEELEYAQNAIGEVGDDNRAGIVGSLHRISAIRSRKGEIIGLTCLVGRAVQGDICMIRDLLDFGASILFVGRPGVGKTTVIREISRVLSDELHKRVVIVDNGSEIGGEGDIPHSAIGGSRRLQVPKPSMQHIVMIEAVKNHMPEVIVVDEIGTEAEVNACRTIAERGIMLIGTAHGEVLENIVKNPPLANLIGGVKSVTLGDRASQRRQCKKIIPQRKSPPTFPFVIEIRERNYWIIHRTARSVDALLGGRKPLVETRQRDENLRVIIERWKTEG